MAFKNILLIDDDADDHEIFLDALIEVSEAISCSARSDAREALDLLIDGATQPDLIFLDLNMPIMSGQQFLTEIKTIDTLRDIPVIILSTSAHQPTIELVKELGAVAFITKPDTFNELTSVLKSLID
jgi:CheY-like chemotaxis protein